MPEKTTRRSFFAFLGLGPLLAGLFGRPTKATAAEPLSSRYPAVWVGIKERVWQPVSGLPDPTPEMLNNNPLFDAIFNAIKKWDVAIPGQSVSGAMGNHARAIYDQIMKDAVTDCTCIADLRPEGDLLVAYYDTHHHVLIDPNRCPATSLGDLVPNIVSDVTLVPRNS